MLTEEEYGPWIEHDGSGCPLPIGTYIKTQAKCECNESVEECIVTERDYDPANVDWQDYPRSSYTFTCTNCGFCVTNECIIKRYAIKKPRGLTIFEEATQVDKDLWEKAREPA